MKRSGIITLLTDFGLKDPYIAMMKGVILSINIDPRIVDINHSINTGSIFQAASQLTETFTYFSKGTIHVAVVDPGVGSDRRLMALEAEDHIFLGPDNGIFSTIIDRYSPSKIFEITEKKYFLPHVTKTFHGRDIFAPAAAYISLGTEINRLGPPLTEPVKISPPMPIIKDGVLYGIITHADNFGNLITNITAADMGDFLKGSSPETHIGKIGIRGICNTYSDVDQGEFLTLINSSDLLEIAVNLDRAFEHAGLDSNEITGTEVKIFKRE